MENFAFILGTVWGITLTGWLLKMAFSMPDWHHSRYRFVNNYRQGGKLLLVAWLAVTLFFSLVVWGIVEFYNFAASL